MTTRKKVGHLRLIESIGNLTEAQVYWLEKAVAIFSQPYQYQRFSSNLISEDILNDFGDGLRLHHCFSLEPFSKDKFEYLLQRTLTFRGIKAILSPKAHRGHDIQIKEARVSLKTQADKEIKPNKIWISKFMELGKSVWGDRQEDLIGLRKLFFEHLNLYDRIFILRALKKSPDWQYELVEIPKTLLKKASQGTLKMMHGSKQFPKPGYCYVNDHAGKEIFKLYFDGGRENKLQVKDLDKSSCILHAKWEFHIPPTI